MPERKLKISWENLQEILRKEASLFGCSNPSALEKPIKHLKEETDEPKMSS